MMKKLIISLLAVTVVANGVLGFFACVQNGDINTLVDELAAIRQEAAAEAASQSAQLETTRQAITSLIGENADTITDLEEDVEANLANINEEAGQITTLGNSLSNLSTTANSIVPGLAADEIYEQSRMAVVEISDGDNTIGAGFIYDKYNHIVTAYHVIAGLDDIYVILADGTISQASIIGSSIRSDVTVLLLENPTTLAPATIRNSDAVTIGDHTLVIGHPLDVDNSLTVGVVSQVDRFESIGSGQDERWIANLIQFDAPANFGNSGSPVFCEAGEVIGMVIAGISPLIGEGVSYAVSSNKIERVADSIFRSSASKFSYPSIGIYVKDITPAEAESAGRENVRGVLVEGLVTPRPPGVHDIRVGDIIVAIKDFPVDDVADLACYLGERVDDWDVIITVIRNGIELELEGRLVSLSYESFAFFWARPGQQYL